MRPLVEVVLCRVREAVDAFAPLDHVEVDLEDARLGDHAIEPVGEEDLLELPLHGPLVGEEDILHQLHADGGGAAAELAAVDGLFDDTAELGHVDATLLLKEGAVFAVELGGDEVVVHVLEGDPAVACAAVGGVARQVGGVGGVGIGLAVHPAARGPHVEFSGDGALGACEGEAEVAVEAADIDSFGERGEGEGVVVDLEGAGLFDGDANALVGLFDANSDVEIESPGSCHAGAIELGAQGGRDGPEEAHRVDLGDGCGEVDAVCEGPLGEVELSEGEFEGEGDAVEAAIALLPAEALLVCTAADSLPVVGEFAHFERGAQPLV